MRVHPPHLFALAVLIVAILVVGCAGGNERFVEKSAGFWAGLWHGLLCVITFIISLFSDTVRMYEVNNSGGWYDCGFLLGAAIFIGSAPARRRTFAPWTCRKPKRDWDEIGKKVEEKVRRGIRTWVEESEGSETDWAEIGRKVEEKIKRELSDWADK